MVALFAFLAIVPRPLTVSELKCESVINPMNVDVSEPRLSWIVASPEEGQRQSAYRILAARTENTLEKNRGDLWDTGKISSSRTIEVPYGGRPLHSTEQVFWKVQVWDGHGAPSKWGAKNRWTMGLLDSSDWKAKWIGASEGSKQTATLYVRKEFRVPKPIKRALCFVSGLGQYEMWLNGQKVGNDWLTPGWTQYAKTCLADSYDVTSQVKVGTNSAAIHIGNGMYDMSGDKRGGQQPNSQGKKKAICQLMFEYEDGTRQTIGSDGSWRSSPSPETYSGVFGGEDWDARLDHPGWKLAGFDDRSWSPAPEVHPPSGLLRGLTHAAPPMRVIEVRSPVGASMPKPNVLVLDLGQNSPYIPNITVSGQAGVTVKLWPAELLKPDGTIDQSTMRAGKYASYTLAGDGAETWHPSFWYVGSRYWQVVATNAAGRSLDPRGVLKRFDGLIVHADVKPTGKFECSNLLFNQIHNLIWWAMCSNFASVISDCPHREKSGWLEQDHLVGDGLMYSFDMSTMFRKVVQDMHDTQLPSGMVPTMAPEYFIYQGGFRDSVEWGGAYLLLPEMMQAWYGQQGLVSQHYEAMKKYVDYLETQAKDGILSTGLGDWNGGGADPRTPIAITDTAYYFDLASTLSKLAVGIGRTGDAARYRQLSDSIKNQFNAKFVDTESGKVGTGSQSAQATALDFHLLNRETEQKAFDQLLSDVRQHDYAVSCGEIGHPALLRVLTNFGRADVVARIHLQTGKPGYGYQIKKGLTTLAESWDASPISQNHFMLGHLMEWLYGDLVGIKPDPAGFAFSRILIQPRIVPNVTWAKASYDSVRGRISCAWKSTGDRVHIEATIPANTSATVFVPCRPGGTVRVSYPLSKGFAMVVSQGHSDGYEPIRVTSGRFVFDSVFR